MADRPFLASQRWQEQQWRAVRWVPHPDPQERPVPLGAHPDILEFERVFIKRMAKLGVPMFAHEVLRSSQRQEDLYALGHSKAHAWDAPHVVGCAVDIVHSTKAWNLDPKQWALVGHVGKELATQRGLKLVWGGDWTFYDPAHWEVEDWKQARDGFPWPKAVT